MPKFIDKIKEKSAKYSYDKKMNAKYTDEERIQECQKILKSVQNHKLNLSLEKKEKLLQIIFGLGHPLQLESNEFEPVLKIILEQSLIEMIKIYELQGKNAQEYYQTLEAINKNLYCILSYKIKQKDAQLVQLQIKNNQWKTNIINKELVQLFNIKINKVYINEKEYVDYVMWRKDQYFKNTKKNKAYKYLMLASFSTFIYLFNWRKLYTKTNRWQNYLIIGLAAFTYYLSNKF